MDPLNFHIWGWRIKLCACTMGSHVSIGVHISKYLNATPNTY